MIIKLISITNFDGVLGLAFPSVSRNPEVTTFIGNLKEKVGVDGMFAFYLADEADGELVIGGHNPDRMQGEIHWVDLVSPFGYWVISLDQVKFGDQVIAPALTGGIMDTGTSLIYGPEDQVSNMTRLMMGAEYDAAVGLYNIPCDTEVPALEFTIGEEPYEVTGDALVIRGNETGAVCFFGVARHGVDKWLIGDV